MGMEEYCDVAIFHEAASQYDKLAVILGSKSCDPCSVLHQLISEADISIPMVDVPTDNCPNMLEHFEVKVLPTIVIMRKGKEVERLEGAGGDIGDIIEKLKKA